MKTPARPQLWQLKAEAPGFATWIPATEGLWRMRPISRVHGRDVVEGGAKFILVRGRAGDGLCVPVDQLADGSLRMSDEIRSVRQLPARAVWEFRRPLEPTDPVIPGE